MNTNEFSVDYVSKRVDVFCDTITKRNFQDMYWVTDNQYFEIEINDAEEFGTFKYTRCTFENNTVGDVIETKVFELEECSVYAALFAMTAPKGTELTVELFSNSTGQLVCNKIEL